MISRKAAKTSGLKFYFTGKPCLRGHVDYRYANSTHCVTCNAEKSVAWVAENPERRREIGRSHMAERRAANPEWAKSSGLKAALLWQKRHPEKANARNAKRRASERNAMPGWVDEFDELVFAEATDLVQRRNLTTGIKWEVDHMLPLQAKTVSGLHVAENLQVIPQRFNSAKQNRLMYTEVGEWVRAL